MGAHSAMLHVRIDDEMKAKATVALEAMGLSASDAVRLLFHRIAADQAFPLELKVPNAETRAAMAEAARIMRSKKLRFRNADELFADLDMPIDVNNPEADALTRKFAAMAGVGIAEAIVIAMKEAIARRRAAETPLETAARIRQKYGVSLRDEGRKTLPKEVFDELWGDDLRREG